MAKSYKNVYTILEKVKKGEIKSYYDTGKDKSGGGGLFGKLGFYKKPDLIKPHLHYLDERRIDSIMDTYFTNGKLLKESFENFQKSHEFRKLATDKKPDQDKFYKKMRENYSKFPKHIVKDIFKMYYNKMDRLDFEERTETNSSKFKFLEKANNPVAKIMTENSSLKSSLFARNILGYYMARLTEMEYIDENAANDIKKCMQGGNDFDNKDAEAALDKMLDGSTHSKNSFEKAMQQATDMCKEMDENIDEEVQEQMFENATQPGSDNTPGKMSPDYIRQVSRELAKITFSMGSLKQKIKKLLDKSVSYFSAKQEVMYEDLFNSDNIAGLEDYELLHPKLRKLFVEDIYVKDTKSVGKIDVYVDISGSMSSGCGIQDNPNLSRIDFCKSFVAKLVDMDMLNNVYVFDNKVKPYKKDLISLSMLDCNGGTTINKAVESIVKNDVNALIITDAEDYCSIYSEKAFFIGLKGCNFAHFSAETIEEYSNKDQVIVFDGSTIQKVNKHGHAVK